MSGYEPSRQLADPAPQWAVAFKINLLINNNADVNDRMKTRNIVKEKSISKIIKP
jgi:hypothetical protein